MIIVWKKTFFANNLWLCNRFNYERIAEAGTIYLRQTPALVKLNTAYEVGIASYECIVIKTDIF